MHSFLPCNFLLIIVWIVGWTLLLRSPHRNYSLLSICERPSFSSLPGMAMRHTLVIRSLCRYHFLMLVHKPILISVFYILSILY